MRTHARRLLVGMTLASTLACVAQVRAEDRPKADPKRNPPASVPSTENPNALRRFWNAVKGQGHYPKSRDWTTGRDDGRMKPWVKR